MLAAIPIEADYWLNFAALNLYARENSAVSSEACEAATAASIIKRFAEDSQSLFGDKITAISELKVMAIECAEENWDGGEAKAIDETALHNAMNFIRALPEGFPMPEFAPEVDGSISMDWIKTRFSLLSLSISGNDRLAYAWLDGSDKGHAVAAFNGSFIPRRLIEDIRLIIGNKNVAFRAA